MNPEKRARRESFRVIVSEIIMVITVAITVLILAFVVSGYWLNADFTVERQGMLQISSIPTGADVKVDGESSWLQRTNTSKILSAGQHEVVLEKEDYGPWSKTVSIKEGLLYRIHYPRLFLTDRTREEIYDTTATKFAVASPDNNLILLIGGTAKWSLVRLNSDKLKAETLDVSQLLSPETLEGTVATAKWDRSGEHVLIEFETDNSSEWALLDIRNISSSTNLTREFGVEFDDIKIFGDSANSLLTLSAGNLQRIDVPSRQISAVLADGVVNFDYYGPEIIFSTKNASSATKNPESSDSAGAPVVSDEYAIFILRNENLEKVATTKSAALPAIFRFYDDNLIAVLCENQITLYGKSSLEETITKTLGFAPTSMKISGDGSFIVMSNGTSGEKIATLDMETAEIVNWSTSTAKYDWLDWGMIYAVKDGNLTVYDYDGLNRRTLSSNVSSKFPVVITADKWLYYFSDNQLVREVIAK